tara:strand:- start:85 stop:321 length:237 start_codon:yes stop_codon:yes gene_type:complete
VNFLEKELDGGFISATFTIEDFTDALTFPADVWAVLSDDDKDVIARSRYALHKANVTAASFKVALPDDELIEGAEADG